MEMSLDPGSDDHASVHPSSTASVLRNHPDTAVDYARAGASSSRRGGS